MQGNVLFSWQYLTSSTNTSLSRNHANFTLESDNLPEINFTFLLPSPRIREQTMAVAVGSDSRAGWRRDGFPSPEANNNPHTQGPDHAVFLLGNLSSTACPPLLSLI